MKNCTECGHRDDMHDADGECWWVSFNPKKCCYCSKEADQ